MELFVENQGNIYDISGMCTDISWTDALNEGASSLEASYIQDGLTLQNGDVVRLTDNNQSNGIFMGMIYKVSRDESGIIQIKAYDQLRRAKNTDIVVLDGGTLKDLVQNMCIRLDFASGTIEETGKVLSPIADCQKTWLDHIIQGISDTLTETDEMYCIRDEYGSVCLWNLRNLQMPLVLGDDSLCTGYTWEKSIDEEFYNRINIIWEDGTSGMRDSRTAIDQESVNRYGMLQYLELSPSGIDNAAKAQEYANNLLKLYNHEKETLSLECMGDLRVRAGNSIYGSIADITMNRRLIVKKATHTFLPVHTMSVEVIVREW